jgi:glycosyltransferase involved in cell wall biosynthesis
VNNLVAVNSPRVCALIPAYNAAVTLAPVIESVRQYVETVIVVDDGSLDDTSRVAQESGATTLRHDVNKGKGEALKLGFEHAEKLGFDVVVTLDADGQHDAREIPRLIEAYRASSPDTFVLGSRAGQMAGMRKVRQWSNRFGTAVISRLAGHPIEDSQTGFRLIPIKAWKLAIVRGSRFDAEAEFLVEACRRGFPLREVRVKSKLPDGVPTSHYRNIRDTLRIARRVFGAWLRSKWRKIFFRGELQQSGEGD